jgi:hypothetical protein
VPLRRFYGSSGDSSIAKFLVAAGLFYSRGSHIEQVPPAVCLLLSYLATCLRASDRTINGKSRINQAFPNPTTLRQSCSRNFIKETVRQYADIPLVLLQIHSFTCRYSLPVWGPSHSFSSLNISDHHGVHGYAFPGPGRISFADVFDSPLYAAFGAFYFIPGLAPCNV